MAKINYKAAVLDYLKEHKNEDVRRDVLMTETSVSKSRLTEVLQSIRDDGYTIVSPNRSGIVRLEIDEENEPMPIEDIKDSDIRKWLIILLLTNYESLTFREITSKLMILKDKQYEQIKLLKTYDGQKKAYDNNALIHSIRDNYSQTYDDSDIKVAKDVISVTVIRTDLNELRDENIVAMKKVFKADTGRYQTKYVLTDQAPCIIPISEDDLFDFCQQFEQSASTLSEAKPLKQAYNRMKALVSYDGNVVEQYHFGKQNQISPKQVAALKKFTAHSYKDHLVRIKTIWRGEEAFTDFATGLIFYSTETGGFYALGRNVKTDQILSLRIEWFLDVTDLPEKNTEFHSQSYYDIYDEMIASQYEPELSHVKVLIQDSFNITSRFQNLTAVRKHAKLRKLDQVPDCCFYDSAYVYEDDIRGLSDFSRYLRKFGASVVALEPAKLRDNMLYTYEHVVSNNEV